MDYKYKLLVSNTSIFAIGNFLVKIISVFLMPIYTSVMTTYEYGIAELVSNLNEILLPLVSLNIVESLFRFSIDDEEDKTRLYSISVFVTVVGNLIFLGISSFLYHVFEYKYSFFIFAICLSSSLYKLNTQFARGLGKSKLFITMSVINSFVLVSLNVYLLCYLKGGIESYLHSIVLSYFITSVLCFVSAKEYEYLNFNLIEYKKLKEMLCFSIPGIANSISWWLNNVCSRYIILFFLGPSSAGIYAASSKIPSLMNTISTIFQQAWQYSSVKEYGKKNDSLFFTHVFNVYSDLCILICVITFFFNKLFCSVLLKGEFYNAWKFVPVLLLSSTIGCISSYFGAIYGAVKKNKLLMYSTFVGGVSNLILNTIMIPLIGIYGSAIASVISYFIITGMRMYHVKSYIAIKYNKTHLLKNVAVLIASTILCCFDNNLVFFINILFTLYILYNMKYTLKQIGSVGISKLISIIQKVG